MKTPVFLLLLVLLLPVPAQARYWHAAVTIGGDLSETLEMTGFTGHGGTSGAYLVRIMTGEGPYILDTGPLTGIRKRDNRRFDFETPNFTVICTVTTETFKTTSRLVLKARTHTDTWGPLSCTWSFAGNIIEDNIIGTVTSMP